MDNSEKGVKLFENVMNNNIYKFLIREYYSHSMNPFKVLKILSRILNSKISRLLKIKYILFFFLILKRLSTSDSIFNQNINPIINETVGDILTRKVDYIIIIHYAIFLVQIGEINFALSRLQIFSTDLRFMNNGELVFYRGVITYLADQNDKNNFFNLIEKSLHFIKKDIFVYCKWVIDFFISKGMVSEISLLCKHDKIREYIDKFDQNKFYFISSINDVEFIDYRKKIALIAQELKNNFINFYVMEKFIEIVINYCNEFKKFKSCSSFIYKIHNLDSNYPYMYINFIYTYFIFSPYNESCLLLIQTFLTDLNNFIEIKSIVTNTNENCIFNLLKQNLSLLLNIVLKQKVLLLFKKTYKIFKYYSEKKEKDIKGQNNSSLKKIINIVEVIKYNYYTIEGRKLNIEIEFNDNTLSLNEDNYNKFIFSVDNIN